MSSQPAPDRDAHHRFCQIEGWIEVTSATGSPVKHHQTFELVLDDGSVLRTRISRPVDRTTYSRRMWSHILRDQLAVSADEFWACVQQNAVPPRSVVAQPDPRALPLYVMNELVTRQAISHRSSMHSCLYCCPIATPPVTS